MVVVIEKHVGIWIHDKKKLTDGFYDVIKVGDCQLTKRPFTALDRKLFDEFTFFIGPTRDDTRGTRKTNPSLEWAFLYASRFSSNIIH